MGGAFGPELAGLLSPRDRRWSWVGGQPARLSAAGMPGAREMGRLHPLSAQTGNRGSGDGTVWPGGSHAGARSALPSVLSLDPTPPSALGAALRHLHPRRSELLKLRGCSH